MDELRKTDRPVVYVLIGYRDVNGYNAELVDGYFTIFGVRISPY